MSMQYECIVATVVVGVLFMWVVYVQYECAVARGRGAVYVGCVAAYFTNNGLWRWKINQ